MNVQSKISRMSPTERLNARRVGELGLASAALFGLAHVRGPVGHAHQSDVMTILNDLFGFTPAESDQASDMLFEATLNHAIADYDRPRIEKCAIDLARIAASYGGYSSQDRQIWAAGYALFEVESLFDASLAPGEAA